MRIRWAALPLLCLPLPVVADTPMPSFSCAAARTPIERAICGDAKLAALDATLDATFRSTIETDPAGKAMLLDGQRAWLASRASQCAPKDPVKPADTACVTKLYEARLAGLKSHDARDTPLCNEVANWIGSLPVELRWHNDLADQLAKEAGGPLAFSGYENRTPALDAKLSESAGQDIDGGLIRHFGTNRAFFAVEASKGTMHCQFISLFKIVSGGAIQVLESPPGALSSEDCPQGTAFASTAGAAPNVPVYTESNTTFPKATMTLWSRRNDAWHSACTIEARSATKLTVTTRFCEAGTDCGALEKAALALAETRDAVGGSSAPKTLGAATLLPPSAEDREELSLPSEEGEDAGAFSEFERNAPVYADAGFDKRAFRISHGTMGWRTDEDWLVGVYDRAHDMKPLAGFAITKSRAALRDVSIR